MKTSLTVLLLLVSFLFTEARTWTNSKGKKIKAEISSATDESVTLILKRNKKEYTFKRTDLSEADQEFITTWVKEKAEALEKNKEAMFKFGDTKLEPGKIHQITMTIDQSRYPEGSKFPSPTYTMGIAVPKGFDPINKTYTIIHITVAGKGQPSKALGQYKNLLDNADCILIAGDDVAYGSNLPTTSVYIAMDNKWDAKVKKWPIAFYGFSGGAKAAAYTMAQAASWDRNIIGAYMTGCNEDRTLDAMTRHKLKPKQKKAYKSAAIWLSSGATDKVATPAHHKRVLESMKNNKMKYVKINTFQGAHMIYKDDQVDALKWMKAQAR
mgnify:CR=1 FL=1